MLQLTFVDQGKPPIWLVKPRYRLGSAEDCDLRFEHAAIMPHHADLVIENEALFVEPVGATSILQVNGKRIASRAALSHGTSLQIADVRMKIVDPKLRADADTELARGWCLQSKNATIGVRRFEVNRSLVLGRASTCGISLAVSHLSREHARLTPTPAGVQVEDLGSSNGTFINGRRITKSLAKPGDELSFDTLKFEITRKDATVDPEATSLRPSISVDDIPQQPDSSDREASVAAARRRPQPAVSSPLAPSGEPEQTSTALLVVGLAVVFVLTLALLIYLMT